MSIVTFSCNLLNSFEIYLLLGRGEDSA